MSQFKQALGNAKLTILSLFIALILSFGLNLFLGVLLYKVPKNMTVFVPPHIGPAGFESKSGQISASQVYRFAYSTWTSLMSWSGNGVKALAHNIKSNNAYLTKPFQNTLKLQMKGMNNQGFLFNHSQVSMGLNGSSFNAKDVKYIGNGTWLVHLDIRSVNYVNSANANDGFGEAHVASDAETSFVFKVTKFPILKGYNTSGLVLAGFAVSPKVIKVYQ
jgi:hypothetical protein